MNSYDLVEKILFLSKKNSIDTNNRDNEIIINCYKYDSFQVLFRNGSSDLTGFVQGSTGNYEILEERMLKDEELLTLIESIKEEYVIANYYYNKNEIRIVFSKYDENYRLKYLVINIEKMFFDESDIITYYNNILFEKFGNELLRTPNIKEKYNEYLDLMKEKIIKGLDRVTILNMISLLNESQLKTLLSKLSNDVFQDIYNEVTNDQEYSLKKCFLK